MWDGVSAGAIALIRRLMTVDPTHRITAQQALCDPWIVGAPSSPAQAPVPVPAEPVLSAPDQQQPAKANCKNDGSPALGTKRQSPDELFAEGTAPKKQRT